MTPTTSTPRAIGYVRVSTEEQAREGVSLDVQAARIRAYCEAKGWTLVEIFRDEGRSAKDLHRPGVQRALELARKRNGARVADVLVVLKLDRLTRSVKDLGTLMEEFRRLRFGFTSIQEAVDTTSATGELFFNIVASISQWERRVIGERTSAALAHKRTQGQRVSRDPFGWQVNGDGRTLHPPGSGRAGDCGPDDHLARGAGIPGEHRGPTERRRHRAEAGRPLVCVQCAECARYRGPLRLGGITDTL